MKTDGMVSLTEALCPIHDQFSAQLVQQGLFSNCRVFPLAFEAFDGI